MSATESTLRPKKTKATSQHADELPPAHKALRTAKWARIMTKWMISHSSKDGVKWQVVSFNGKKSQESKGIVDMIAIRKKITVCQKLGHIEATSSRSSSSKSKGEALSFRLPWTLSGC